MAIAGTFIQGKDNDPVNAVDRAGIFQMVALVLNTEIYREEGDTASEEESMWSLTRG